MKSRFFLVFILVISIFSFASAQQAEAQPKAGDVKLTPEEDYISVTATGIKEFAALIAKSYLIQPRVIQTSDLLALKDRIGELKKSMRNTKKNDQLSILRLSANPDFLWVLDADRALDTYFKTGFFRFKFVDDQDTVKILFSILAGKPVEGVEVQNRWLRRIAFGMIGGFLLMILAWEIISRLGLFTQTGHMGLNLLNVTERASWVMIIWLILCLFVLR